MQSNGAPERLAGGAECGIVFCRGILQLSGTTVDRCADAHLNAVDAAWRSKRRERDGDHFHVTILTKADLQRACMHFRGGVLGSELTMQLQLAGLSPPDPDCPSDVARCIARLVESRPNGPSSWVSLGIGCAKDDGGDSSFLVLLWPAGNFVRKALELETQDFHITLGFRGHDVHGKPKGPSTLIDGAPAADSLLQLIREAAILLESGIASDIDEANIEQLVDVAMLGCLSDGDEEVKREALHALCKIHGQMKRPEKVLMCADRLLELTPEDGIGSRNRAFALVMLKQYQEALPALEHARGKLHEVEGAQLAAEEDRFQQAYNLCIKKMSVVG